MKKNNIIEIIVNKVMIFVYKNDIVVEEIK